jgi:hypothetical protein
VAGSRPPATSSSPMRPGQLRQQGIGAGLGGGQLGRGTSSPRAGQDPGVEAEASKGNHGGSTLQKGQTS